MALLKRIGFYVIGLSIGIIILAVLLKKKAEGTGVEFCYFPNCRVLKDLRSKPMVFSDDINELLRTEKLDSTDISSFFREGNIDFGKSNTKSKPCKTYVIEGTVNERAVVMEVDNCLQNVVVKELVFNAN